MENLDGVWRAVYEPEASGQGFVVLRQGRILGCDEGWFIEGSYEVVKASRLTGRIRVSRYNEAGESIFGSFRPVDLRSYSLAVERADRVLQHLADPRVAFEEMVRVTKPGGTVQIVDRDWGLVAVESNDQAVTRKILDRICGKIRNGWIGRRVPVLFRECGLQEVRVEALPITVQDFRVADRLLDLTLVAGHAADEGIVSPDEKRSWLLELQERNDAGQLDSSFQIPLSIVSGTSGALQPSLRSIERRFPAASSPSDRGRARRRGG